MAMELRVPVVAPPLCRQIKCFRPFSDEDGGGSGVGFGEAGAKLLVLHGQSFEVLVCSFLLIDGGLDFPFVGLLSWLLLHAVAVDFFWVAGSFGDAGFVLFQGQDDDGRYAPEGRCLAATKCWWSRRAPWLSFSPAGRASSPTPAEPEEVRCVGAAMREDPGSAKLNSMFLRV